MSISTYAELKTAVANFLARTDLDDQIPNFIQLAEARMSRELETREQEKRATATLAASDVYVALPTDLREIREVKLNTSPVKVLTYFSPSSLDQQYSASTGGKPVGYSVVGRELKVRPIPDSSYTAEIVYIATLPAISDSSTPTLFTRSPDIYLYGALAEAYAYLLDEQRAAQYDEKFTRAINEVKLDEERSHYGSGSLQIKSAYMRQNSIAQR